MKLQILLPSLSLLGLIIVHGQSTTTPTTPDATPTPSATTTTPSSTTTPDTTPTTTTSSDSSDTPSTSGKSKKSHNKSKNKVDDKALKPCLKIAQKAQTEIQANKTSKALKELEKLQKSWEAISPTIKSNNEAKWKKIDSSLDAALSAVKGGGSSASSAIETLVSALS